MYQFLIIAYLFTLCMQRNSSRGCHLTWKDHSSLLMRCASRVDEWFNVNMDNSGTLTDLKNRLVRRRETSGESLNN